MKDIVKVDDNFDYSTSIAVKYLRNQWENLLDERNQLLEVSSQNQQKSKQSLISRIIRNEFNYYSEPE